VGTGVLRFFGLRVYEARLWAAPGFLPEDYARHPFALELVYDRKLEGAAIAERSIAPMRRGQLHRSAVPAMAGADAAGLPRRQPRTGCWA
jgi:hypothetical protein